MIPGINANMFPGGGRALTPESLENTLVNMIENALVMEQNAGALLIIRRLSMLFSMVTAIMFPKSLTAF